MLTVDYDRLAVAPGDLVLDLGCGAGRHAYEARRRGASVVALDADGAEVKEVAQLLAALAHDEPGTGGQGWAQVASALALPFPDGTFDRIIAAEVLEHIPDDAGAMAELARVLRPGGTLAVTVPRWLPELVCWALSSDYHETPGGHVRIYRRPELLRRLERTGLVAYERHHAHALHSAYWWLRCALGADPDTSRLVAAYHRVLVWDIMAKPRLTRLAEQALNPIVGKSLVVYLRKPVPGLDGGGSDGVAETAAGDGAEIADAAESMRAGGPQ